MVRNVEEIISPNRHIPSVGTILVIALIMGEYKIRPYTGKAILRMA